MSVENVRTYCVADQFLFLERADKLYSHNLHHLLVKAASGRTVFLPFESDKSIANPDVMCVTLKGMHESIRIIVCHRLTWHRDEPWFWLGMSVFQRCPP
jgi:hypothetical protein